MNKEKRKKTMGLNFGGSGGDFLPFLKFNAKAGRFYTKNNDVEVEVANPTFVADLNNIKTGWICYAEGQAPNYVWDVNLSTPAPKPSDKHKRGFMFNIFGKDVLSGVREFASASMHACAAINDVYTTFESEKHANPGKYPVLSCTGTTPQKDKMGTNYRPNFAIQKWVDAPQELKDAASGSVSTNTNVAYMEPVKKVVSEF